MTQEIVVRHSDDKILAITEIETRFAMAIRQRELLESYIRDRLKPDKHFYTVGDDPGRKPSLTKEGAELINLPHALKPKYNILTGPEKPPADNSPFQITVNCSLWRNDKFEGEGIGSASSYITKKDGSFQPRQKDPGLCYNATVKMASKSAYIAATLNSTAASEFFTQDLEDDQTGDSKKIDKTQHWCITHNTAFFKKGKMTSFAHPIEGTKDWCHEPKAKEVSPESPVETPPDAPPQATVAGEAQSGTQPFDTAQGKQPVESVIDMAWLREKLEEIPWPDAGKWLREHFKVTGKSVSDMVSRLSPEQQKIFAKEVEDRLSVSYLVP